MQGGLETSRVLSGGGRRGYGDAYWRHDPRLQLLANTLEQPYNGSVSGAVLPNVAKTFLNEHTCVPLEQKGSIASYTSATFQLNQTMIRHFYDLDDRLVYVVDGNPIARTRINQRFLTQTSLLLSTPLTLTLTPTLTL